MNTEVVLTQIDMAISRREYQGSGKWALVWTDEKITCVHVNKINIPQGQFAIITEKEAQEGFSLKQWGAIARQAMAFITNTIKKE